MGWFVYFAVMMLIWFTAGVLAEPPQRWVWLNLGILTAALLAEAGKLDGKRRG